MCTTEMRFRWGGRPRRNRCCGTESVREGLLEEEAFSCPRCAPGPSPSPEGALLPAALQALDPVGGSRGWGSSVFLVPWLYSLPAPPSSLTPSPPSSFSAPPPFPPSFPSFSSVLPPCLLPSLPSYQYQIAFITYIHKIQT